MQLNNMKIKYIVNARIPTEKAHGYQICKMCVEFAARGIDVELIVPTRKNEIKEDAFSFYDLARNFKINYIRSFDALLFVKYLGVVSFYWQSFLFFLKLIFYKIGKDNIIYTRSPEIAWLCASKKYKTFYEAHNWPESKVWLYKFFLKNCQGIICNSDGTENAFKADGFKKTLVAPNGVDLKDFELNKNQSQLRQELDLPLEKKIIMYIGHLYLWKGADVIIDLAEILKDIGEIYVVLIGGTQQDINKYRKICKNRNITNVLLVGYKHHNILPKYLKAADILLLPNAPVTTESIQYTSPIKMFEYMASGRPIIASDLPSIQKVLDKDCAIFFKAGDAVDLAGKINWLIKHEEVAKKVIENAENKVKNYTWEKRAQSILKFIE